MKRTYYFDNSARVYENKFVVIGEAKFRKIKDNYLDGWMHNWISGEFNSLEEAKEAFRKEWMEG